MSAAWAGEAVTVGRQLAGALRSAGVGAVYGRPLPGLAAVDVPDGPVARMLAVAHRRVHGQAAATLDGDRTLGIGPDDVAPRRITSPDDLPGAVDLLAAAAHGAASARLVLDVDLGSPAAGGAAPVPPPVDRHLAVDERAVDLLAAAEAPVVLAGPGVVGDGAVPGLHALAAAGSLGVLNTWGAKGVFDWRSRHHLATAGLQADDFTLGGLGDADLIVATGVDEAEAPAGRWRLAPVLTVAPGALDPLAEVCRRPWAEIAVPPLRSGLARVTQDGWAQTTGLLAPSRATRAYAVALGAGGLVAADPGVAGYWVARTFATTGVGGALVTADGTARGFAAACALVARLRDPARAVLAVVDGSGEAGGTAGEDAGGLAPDGLTARIVEAGARRGVVVPVEVWCPTGEAVGPDEHAARLDHLLSADRPVTVTLATDPAQLSRMIDVAGPVVAWDGSAVGPPERSTGGRHHAERDPGRAR